MPFNLYEVWKSVDTSGVEPRRGVVTAIDPAGNEGQLLLDNGELRSISWPLHDWDVDTSPKPTLSANELRQKILGLVHRQPACPGEMDVEIRGTRENDWEAISIPPPGQPLAYTDCAAYISSLARAFRRLYGLRTMPDEEVLPPGWMNSDQDANDTVVRIAAERQHNFFAATQSGAVEPFPPGVPQPPEPRPSPTPSVVEGAFRGSSFDSGASSGFGSGASSSFGSGVSSSFGSGARSGFGSGSLSVEPSDEPAGVGSTSTGVASIVERRLSERPGNILAAAQALSNEIEKKIEQLRAEVPPNDPDSWAVRNDIIEFLEQVAAELDALVDSIELAIAAGSAASPEPILLGKAAVIARKVEEVITKGLERNSDYIVDRTIKLSLDFSLYGLGYLFLHALGVDDKIAGIVSQIILKK